ncbi:MAG: hypothetical protein ACH346_07665 [Chthoniobacterales bacterium]
MDLFFRRIGIFFLITSGLLSFAKAGSTYSLVTAREYCQFLNNSPSNYSDYRYDDVMSSGPDSASILRQGKPGGYFYEVIAGRENYPVYYVSFSNEKLYYDWLQEEAPEDVMTDTFLKSNSRAFQVSQLENSQALFFGTSDSEQKSDWNPYAKNILVAAAVAAMLKGGYDYYQGEIGDRPVLADRSRVDIENRVPPAIVTETPETSDSSMTLVAFPTFPGLGGTLANETRLTSAPNVQNAHIVCHSEIAEQYLKNSFFILRDGDELTQDELDLQKALMLSLNKYSESGACDKSEQDDENECFRSVDGGELDAREVLPLKEYSDSLGQKKSELDDKNACFRSVDGDNLQQKIANLENDIKTLQSCQNQAIEEEGKAKALLESIQDDPNASEELKSAALTWYKAVGRANRSTDAIAWAQSAKKALEEAHASSKQELAFESYVGWLYNWKPWFKKAYKERAAVAKKALEEVKRIQLKNSNGSL